MPKIIGIVGRSNSGKTTLIEKLIKYYTNKQIVISIIKHMKHDFEIDHKGKDTYRYREAGAFSSVITNDNNFAIVSDNFDEMTPEDIANNYLTRSSLVIVEGYRDGDLPKIEVIGESSDKPLFNSGIRNIKALVSDYKITSELPVFKRDDIKNIANYIERILS